MADKKFQITKPRPIAAPAPGSEEAIRALVERGGSSPAEKSARSAQPKRKSVIVYFAPDVLERVDQACARARILTPRQRWIMEAVLEKLDREEASQS